MSFKLENKSVTQSIAKLYQNAESADVHFQFKMNNKSRKVLAHKLILAASSPVFYTMFFGPINEKGTIETIEISDMSASVFREFLQFFYLDEVYLTIENIEGVTVLAEKYEMHDCLKICAEFLGDHVTIDKLCLAYQLAINIGNEQLMRKFEKSISIFPMKVFSSKGFLSCKQIVLKHILQLDFLLCDEIDLFNACLHWAEMACKQLKIDEKHPQNLKAQLGDCFYLIRFGAIKAEAFATFIANKCYTDLFTKDEIVDIFYTTSIKNFKSSKFNGKPRSLTTHYWKPDPALECNRKEVHSESVKHCVNNEETVRFSTNVPVLLGEFYCPTLRHLGDYTVDLDFMYTIIELRKTDEKTNAKILRKGNVKLGVSDARVCLPRPLLIDNENIYEIRFNSMQTLDKNFYHYLSWKTEVNLRDGAIKVTFHHDAKSRMGLITRLCFNRIDDIESLN